MPLDKLASLEPTRRAFSLYEEFKAFAFKGNVIDLAIGVIIGAAFGKVVDSLVKHIIMPLISLLIMPMALLSLLAIPFGLEAWPLKAMGLGIEFMVGTGEWVASFPGAVSVLPQISGASLVLMVLGGLWLCLWQTRTRALGLVIAASGLALTPHVERPDVLIERDGATAALRSSTGNLVFPPATAAMRVGTLPRMGTMFRSGRTARSCASRRRELVPTVAPLGSPRVSPAA